MSWAIVSLFSTAAALSLFSPAAFPQISETLNLQGHYFDNMLFQCPGAGYGKPPAGLPANTVPGSSLGATLKGECPDGSVEVSVTANVSPGVVTSTGSKQDYWYDVAPTVTMTLQVSAKFTTSLKGSFHTWLQLIPQTISCRAVDGNLNADFEGPGSKTLSTSQTCTINQLRQTTYTGEVRYIGSDFEISTELYKYHDFGASRVIEYFPVTMSGSHGVSYMAAPVPADISEDLASTSLPTCPAPAPSAALAKRLQPRSAYGAHLTAIAGSATPATGILTLACASKDCNADVTIEYPPGGWLKITPTQGKITGSTPLKVNVSADASKLTSSGGPYTADLTIKGNIKDSPRARQIALDVLPACESKIQITSAFPAPDEAVWGAAAPLPSFRATVQYAAPAEGEVSLQLVDKNDELVNVGDKTIKVKEGPGSVSLSMSPLVPLGMYDDFYLQAILRAPGTAGRIVETKSAKVHYKVVPGPEVIAVPGTVRSDGGFAALDQNEGLRWSETAAVRVILTFQGKPARISAAKELLWGDESRGESLLPPRTISPGDSPLTLALEDSVFARPRNANRYRVRVLLRNESTLQLVIAKPVTLGLDAVHITGCEPDPNKGPLNLRDSNVTCKVEYSLGSWRTNLIERLTVDGQQAEKRKIKELSSGDRGEITDSLRLPDASVPISTAQVAYFLADDDDTYAMDGLKFLRIMQSLDDALKLVGRDRVAAIAGGLLSFANGLHLPGKLGNVIKMADDACSGASSGTARGLGTQLGADLLMVLDGKKTDCLTKLQEAYNQLMRPGGKNAAAADMHFFLISSTWAFDSPVPKNGTFEADLTLQYTPDVLPDHPDFDESKLQIVSWDPDAKVFEILPTTLDRANRSATTHLDHLAPYYSLAMIAPASGTILRTPVLLGGTALASGLAISNLSTSPAKVSLGAFAGDGSPFCDRDKRPSMQAPSAGQVGGVATEVIGSGATPMSQWLEITADRQDVTGVQVLGGAGAVAILPLESAAANSWVLSHVEESTDYRTTLHLANGGMAPASIFCDLRAADGTSAGTFSGSIEARGKLEQSLSAMFRGLPNPFTGYLTLTAGQNITAAALIVSDGTVTALSGKQAPPGTTPGRLYAPLVGGTTYSAQLTLVNLGTRAVAATVRGFRPDGTAVPSASVNVPALGKYTGGLAQVFGTDPGAVSLQIESPNATLVGDVILSDAAGQDSMRASLPLVASPQVGLVLPYVVSDGTTVTSLAISNPGTKPAAAKLSLFTPDGSKAASGMLNIAAGGSAAGTLNTLLPGAAVGGYITISADQPVTAMAILDPHVRDIAAMAAMTMPGTGGAGPSLNPQMTLTPAALDFGSIAVNQTKDLSLAIGNTGSADLLINAVGISGSAFRLVSAQVPLTVGSGKSAVVTVRFAPTASGTAAGTLTIGSNDPQRPSATVALSGSAAGGTSGPQLFVRPSSLEFGTVNIGSSKDVVLSVANAGTSTLTISAIAFDNARFALVSSVPPWTIAAGSQSDLTIRFTPSATGAASGNLTITSNDAASPRTVIPLTGQGAGSTGATARISVTPASLDFGSVIAGENRQLVLTVSNSGGAVLTVSAITSDNARYTVISPSVPFPVGPGAQQAVTIRFAPPVGGSQTGALSIASNDPDQPTLKVAVSGMGFLVSVLFSDSFNRRDADGCSLGTADLALGGSGSYYYLPIFPYNTGSQVVPIGAGIANGSLMNNGKDFGGVQFASTADVCGLVRGMTLAQNVSFKVDLLVPSDSAGRITQAGPYFRSRSAAPADGIIGGESAGYWVQLDSNGEVKVKQLNPWAVVAFTGKPAAFDSQKMHTLEATADGNFLQVALDGKLLTFSQNGAKTTTVAIPATVGQNHGTAGIAFGADDNRYSLGGQRADNLVVSTVKPLSGYPVQSNLP